MPWSPVGLLERLRRPQQLGSDMLVDAEYDEKQDVAIISPDDAMDEAEQEPEPRADDFEAMKKRYMPELPDLDTEAEAAHTWEIKEWRNMARREHGPVFKCADHPWRILFFPYGNNTDHASFYLEQGFDDSKPPEDWYACVQFMLVLWNPNDPSIYVQHSATHRFTGDEGDWGFTRFAELRKLFQTPWEDRDRPLVENNSANVTAYVRVIKDPTGVLWHNFVNYDSKKETGMVGLKNQGATCYLNSLLQSLYFTNAFRKAVYQIPTENEAERSNSAYALQRLFYQLQTSNVAVSTNELTASFGWDSRQIFEQQDVQELSRILMERMEEKMKGTEAENALPKMFVGKMKTYISCINVPYESSRIEDFWDIQLNVSGNKNLDDSFKDYIQVETMDGENKYFAEGYGLQDAKKGVIFESFPDVLHLQLKRFEYDFNRDAMMKVNDRYEFPEVWDAAPYLSESADKSEPYLYHLHGVLVHSGDLNAGHYYAFLKPTKDSPYFKFDDDRVTRATVKEALEENFGGDYTNLVNGNAQQRNPYTRTWSTKRSMSAYMLVYIRESRLDQVLPSDEEVQPPTHLAQKFAEERAAFERKKKEREEMHLYLHVSVATEKNFTSHQGFDVAPWSKDVEGDASPKTYKVLRTMTIADFTSMVAQDIGAEAKLLRPWAMVNRQNGTVRPDAVITFPDMTVEEAATKFGTKSGNFKVWMEETKETDAEGKPVFGDAHVDLHGVANNRPIMLYLKYFDPDEQTLFGIGTFYAAWQDKVMDLSPQILKLVDLPAGTNLKLFEEIKSNMIEQMKPKVTLASSEIQDGDIITVQKSLSEKEAAAISSTGRYTDVREFYDYLLNRVHVHLAQKGQDKDNDTSFYMWLSKKMTYDQFAAKVGEHLKVDPTHIRFSTVNISTGKPKLPIKRTANMTLSQILYPSTYPTYGNPHNQRVDALYYEILEYSLSEMDQMKSFRVSWLPEGVIKEEQYDILVAKNGTMDDLIKGLQKKAGFDDATAAKVRLYDGSSNRFKQEIPREKGALSIHEFATLYAEKIPEEESTIDSEAGDSIITCFHFDKEPSKPHGIPFVFAVKAGEAFKDTKERLSKRTGIKGKQLEKIKFAIVVGSGGFPKAEYLGDDDILAEKISSHQEDISLGLDHVNKARSTWGKTDSIFIK
ncbi:putative ubiquitin c-terminal hydrolase protein [Lasiodiplodia theobromae]|uniref:ubiquitinyl hydrolase 1 n=1 Tax=Lasiodiplodia theobromae TaxID=45133 RepID=A0A5N5DLL5_9PEZI|nr:Ubiquitin carboxyl-terminal hydrolase [Lasiodiplodia theobromae]KAB2578221.1 Ubiquitin carboxyl-terminal hydrolase 13 [Lasiodiplodia theobromae]KAF4544202.1 Ubiquitin carboxyl-terminal hydrolase [Lasiodiplodia theobromae]KAF9641308.1 putative ubiquitin c-terminal hydrolase protein [Lasiodiplodia theobromae]